MGNWCNSITGAEPCWGVSWRSWKVWCLWRPGRLWGTAATIMPYHSHTLLLQGTAGGLRGTRPGGREQCGERDVLTLGERLREARQLRGEAARGTARGEQWVWRHRTRRDWGWGELCSQRSRGWWEEICGWREGWQDWGRAGFKEWRLNLLNYLFAGSVEALWSIMIYYDLLGTVEW